MNVSLQRLPSRVLAGLGALCLVTAGNGTAQQALKARLGCPGEQLIVASESTADGGALRIFDLKSGRLLWHYSHPDWTTGGAGRPLTVDENGHIWIIDSDQVLYELDRQNRFLRSFSIDTSCAGSPAGNGIGGLAFGPNGTLFAVGKWLSCSVSYLFEIDPETEETLRCVDLHAVVGSFCANSVDVGPAAQGQAGPWIYISESASPGSGRVAVFDAESLLFIGTRSDPGFANVNLGSVRVLPGGAILVSDVTNGRLWLSTADQASWQQLFGCSAASYGVFDVAHGFAYAGNAMCGPGPNYVALIRLSNGAVQDHIDVSASGRFSAGSHALAVRHR